MVIKLRSVYSFSMNRNPNSKINYKKNLRYPTSSTTLTSLSKFTTLSLHGYSSSSTTIHHRSPLSPSQFFKQNWVLLLLLGSFDCWWCWWRVFALLRLVVDRLLLLAALAIDCCCCCCCISAPSRLLVGVAVVHLCSTSASGGLTAATAQRINCYCFCCCVEDRRLMVLCLFG